MCPGLRNKTCKLQVTGTKVKTLTTKREVPGDRHGLGAITYYSVTRRPCRARGVGVEALARPSAATASQAHAGPTAPIGFFPFRHEAPPTSPVLYRRLKKKKKGFSHPVTTRGSGRPLTWQAGQGSVQPGARTVQRIRPNRRPKLAPRTAESALRRMRAAGGPRAQPLPARRCKCGSGSVLRSPAGRSGW